MDEVKDKITTKILFKAPGENVCVLVQSKPKSYLINPAASPNDPRRSHRSELRTSLTLNCIGSSISILVPHNPKSIDKTISLMKKTLRWLGISDIKKGGNALVFVAATPSSSSVSFDIQIEINSLTKEVRKGKASEEEVTLIEVVTKIDGTTVETYSPSNVQSVSTMWALPGYIHRIMKNTKASLSDIDFSEAH